MRFQIKKLLEGYDPADLIEQSMYCFGSDSGGDDGSSDAVGSEEDPNSFGGDDPTGNTGGQTDMGISDPSSVGNDEDTSDSYGGNMGMSDAEVASAIGTANAISSIANNGYSPNSVTGFANPTDVSDFTTADQMTSMSNVNNMAQKGMFPNIPTPLGAVLNNISKIGAQNTIDNINMGYTPTYSGGQVTGTTGFGIGMGSPTGAVDGYGIFSNTSPSEMSFGGMNNMGGGETEPIKPATTNPVSGQPVCPDGYRFDDDLQACRLDTTRPNRPNNPNPFPASEAYYRATSLDKAPMNVPSGFDFNKANQNFISQFAYRPSAYQNQMGLSGFTPFRRS